MGKNIVTMVIAMFAALAVLGIIYAVNNVGPNAPLPFEDVLLPEGEELPAAANKGDDDMLVVPPEFMPGANMIPGMVSVPEEPEENKELLDIPGVSSDIDNQELAGGEPGNKDGEVFCTMDAKMCPDGSFVGRIAPNCEFAPCPEE